MPASLARTESVFSYGSRIRIIFDMTWNTKGALQNLLERDIVPGRKIWGTLNYSVHSVQRAAATYSYG
jgi:hypothetical protein